MIFDATVGGPNSTSYLTVVEANDYFSGRLHSGEWAVVGLNKEVALMTATRMLDRYITFQGTKATEQQALAWPRYGVIDADGYSVPITIIPQDVKDAVCEMAYSILLEDRSVDDPLKGFKSIKVDTLAIEVDTMETKAVIPDAVWASLGCLAEGETSGSSMEVKLVRC